MNILYIMTDQHNAACTGYEGHSQVLTPHLDQFAAQGTRFSHAYTANPICTPTRVSILSGQYCHNHGYYGLGGPRPANLPHFLGHFRDQGYHTALIGKGHLPIDPEDWLEGEVDLLADQMRHATGPTPYATEYLQALKDAGFPEEFDSETLLDKPGKGNYAIDARPSRLPFELSPEGYSNRRAMAFIDEALDAGKPFCIELSYQRPHQCYTPAQDFWDLYPDDLDLPYGAFSSDNSGRSPHFRKQVDQTRPLTGGYEPSDSESRMRRVWKGYLASITHSDHAFGEMMTFLEERGLKENTVVVYNSDHGAYSGLFGVLEKAPGICSEQVCRVPLMVRAPGVSQPNHLTPRFAHTVDIAPTLCALAGISPMSTVDGLDLSPLLRGEDVELHEVAVTEHPFSKSLRWKQWRYVHYLPEMFSHESFAAYGEAWQNQPSGELYNLDEDPWEQHNLFQDPETASVLHECRRLLLDWLIRSNRVTTNWPPRDFAPGKAVSYPLGADGKTSPSDGPLDLVHRGILNYL